MGGLAVGQHPDVGSDAGVVEEVERQGDDGLQPVVLDQPTADVALALAGVAGEQGGAVVDLGDAAAQFGLGVHFRRHVGQEQHLAVAGARHQREFLALVHDLEAGVEYSILAAHGIQVFLPALAVGRIGEHEVEGLGREGVVGQGGPLGAADDPVGVFALALEQHVGLADSIGFGIDLLAVEQTLDLLAALGGDGREGLFRHGEHAAGAAGAVVEQVGAGFDLGRDGQEDQVGHQPHGVARGPVLAGLFVVVLVEFAHQLFEHRAHGVVVDAGRRQVDVGVEEFLDQGAEGVGAREGRQLVTKLEILQDVLDVG